MAGRRPDRDRLAKIAALFQSPVDGERLAAVDAFTRVLRANGSTWDELLAAAQPAPKPAKKAKQARRQGGGDDHRAIIVELMRSADALTAWEKNFLAEASAFPYLSDKQWRILSQVSGKVSMLREAGR